MGLDMYLYRKTYIWNDEKTGLKITVAKTASNNVKTAVGKINPHKVNYITEQVGYWRKANHIHQWFVNNIQDGKDDCGEYYISGEKLKSLRDLCQLVLDSSTLIETGETYKYWDMETSTEKEAKLRKLEDSAKAQELLPTAEGFFFGGTSYDEFYVNDLEDTIKIIDEVLEAYGEDAGFEYQSSW